MHRTTRSLSEPNGDGSPEPAADPGATAVVPCWVCVRYRLPSPPAPSAGAKEEMRRALRRRNAVALASGRWALPLDPAGTVVARLQEVADGLGVPVQITDGTDHRRLTEACERSWDPIVRRGEVVGARPARPSTVRDLRDLRVRFGRAWSRDLVATPRGEEAAVVLGGVIRDVEDRAGRPLLGGRPRGERRLVGPHTAVLLSDGTVRFHYGVLPEISTAWEQGFDAFARELFHELPGEVALRHGSAQVRCPPQAIDDIERRLGERMRLFDLYLRNPR